MTRYTTEVETDTGWTIWLQPLPGYRLACCDCGLVHDMEFRVEAGAVQFRARRNMRSTAARRRKRAEAAHEGAWGSSVSARPAACEAACAADRSER